MVMSAKALLERNPRPTNEDIRKALNGASVPLRHAQPYRACRAARGEGNAVMTSRRDFLKSSGALVLAFSFDHSYAQGARPACPGSLDGNRMLECLAAHRRRRHGDGLHAARSSSGRASAPRSRRSRPTSSTSTSSASRMVHGDTALTPNEGQTAGSLSVQNSGTARALRVRRSAGDAALAAAAKLGAQELKGDGWHGHLGSGKEVTYWTLAGELDLKKEATGQREAQAAVGAQAGRQERPSAATSRRSSPAAPRTCRTCACRRWCSGASCARRPRRDSWFPWTRIGQEDARA